MNIENILNWIAENYKTLQIEYQQREPNESLLEYSFNKYFEAH